MRISIIIFLLFISPGFSYADTLCLKNGQCIDGIVKSDDGNVLELEVGLASSVSFFKSEIESVKKGDEKESEALRQQWQEKLAMENKTDEQKPVVASKPVVQSPQKESKPEPAELPPGNLSGSMLSEGKE